VTREGEDAFEAAFVRVGPGDGQLIALVNGEEELLDESYTMIGTISKAKKPAAKTTKKAPKK
jgi:hypothetical protein